MKKVIVIGAGIAGLTCGNYLQASGFDTEIYELHSIPGGECTGWDRKGYHFDGCLHWLVGSKPGTPLNQVWRDTGALDDTVNIINHEIYTRYEEGGAFVNFYTDTDKLEEHLISISPEDKRAIRSLCDVIRKGSFDMPIEKPMDMMTAGDGIKFAAKNIGKLGTMSKYGSMTMKELAAGFKSPLIQRALLGAMPGDYPSIAFVTMMAGMNQGDCGYPEGGSRALALRMEKKFLSRGGKVFYKARVEKILEENGKAAGIRLADGSEIAADYVVSCADAYVTFKGMLGDKHTPEMYENLFVNHEKYPTVTSSLVFLGIDAKLDIPYRSIEIECAEPVSMQGITIHKHTILNYGFDKVMQPEGKSVLACYYGGNYDFWQGIHTDKQKYEEEKQKLAADAIAAVAARFPEVAGKIEVTDVVTPITYERYCNAWRGAWMTWTNRQKGVPQYFPGTLPSLGNFILAGMWTLPPGGLPGAGASGRFAAHRICLWNGMDLKTAE